MDCSFLADRWMKLRVHLTDLVKLFLNYNFKKKVSHTQTDIFYQGFSDLCFHLVVRV